MPSYEASKSGAERPGFRPFGPYEPSLLLSLRCLASITRTASGQAAYLPRRQHHLVDSRLFQ